MSAGQTKSDYNTLQTNYAQYVFYVYLYVCVYMYVCLLCGRMVRSLIIFLRCLCLRLGKCGSNAVDGFAIKGLCE